MLTADRLKPLQDELAFSLTTYGMFWSKQKRPSWLCCSSPWCLLFLKNDPDFFPGDPSHRCRGRFGYLAHDLGAPRRDEGLGYAWWGSKISQLGTCPWGLKVCLVYHQLWSRLEEIDLACGHCRNAIRWPPPAIQVCREVPVQTGQQCAYFKISASITVLEKDCRKRHSAHEVATGPPRPWKLG